MVIARLNMLVEREDLTEGIKHRLTRRSEKHYKICFTETRKEARGR